MITTSRTMPESDSTPEDLSSGKNRESNRESNRDRPAPPEIQPNLADVLLNSSELQTVLDMLAVMETAEELDQLQALTEAQKRQVWEATSESLKKKLWQLRNQPSRDRSTANPNTDSTADSYSGRSPETLEREAQDDLQDEYLEEDYYESESDRESDRENEIEDLGQDLELTADSYSSAASGLIEAGIADLTQSGLTAAPAPTGSPPADRSTPVLIPEVGDRVILKAQPRLTTAELKAVWQLQKINGDNGEVYDTRLGVRIYPLSWMVVYAKAEPEDLAAAPPNSPESEEDF